MLKKIILPLAALTLASLPCGQLRSEDISVQAEGDADCSDASCGLQAALDTAAANRQADVLRLEPGIYRQPSGPFQYAPGSDENFPLEIRGAREGVPVLDGESARQILNLNLLSLSQDADADVTLEGLSFVDGRSSDSGAALIFNADAGSLFLNRSSFRGNNAEGAGGGISVNTGSGDISIAESEFLGNVAGTFGGGVDIFSRSGDVTTFSCEYSGNSSGVFGGGFEAATSGILRVENNHFKGNRSAQGGAFSLDVQGDGSGLAANNVLLQNHADERGGGGQSNIFDRASFFYFNNDFLQNTSGGKGGGAIHFFAFASQGTVDLRNNLFFGNASGGSDQIPRGEDLFLEDRPEDVSVGGSATLANNLLRDFASQCALSPDCQGSISESGTLRDVDPELVDLAGEDFHLRDSSALIDSGTEFPVEAEGVFGPLREDFEGNPRVLGESVDVGADEFGPCGDGELGAEFGETCDDGNLTTGDGCDASCRLEEGVGGNAGGSALNGGACYLAVSPPGERPGRSLELALAIACLAILLKRAGKRKPLAAQ